VVIAVPNPDDGSRKNGNCIFAARSEGKFADVESGSPTNGHRISSPTMNDVGNEEDLIRKGSRTSKISDIHLDHVIELDSSSDALSSSNNSMTRV